MTRGFLLSVLVCSSAFAGAPEEAPPSEAPDKVDVIAPFELEPSSSLRMTVTHLFTRALARERVLYLLEYWAKRFGIKHTWRGDQVFLTGKVWGVDVKAVFDVQDHQVLAQAHDPGSMLTSAATRYVNSKLRKYLHPQYEEP
jgi:hypothetical protein